MIDEKIITYLRTHLTEEKFLHSLGTAQYAKKLAAKYGLDEDKAYVTGLLHDCAKRYGETDKTIHAPKGAELAQKEFNITDIEILDAIRHHTIGKIDMTDFQKIIFLADKAEPHTRDKKFTKKIEALLNEDNGLNKALLECYKATIKKLTERNLKIRPETIEIYNYLLT